MKLSSHYFDYIPKTNTEKQVHAFAYHGSEVPLKQTERKPSLALLARPAEGFLDLGCPGLVLEPLIQGGICP